MAQTVSIILNAADADRLKHIAGATFPSKCSAPKSCFFPAIDCLCWKWRAALASAPPPRSGVGSDDSPKKASMACFATRLASLARFRQTVAQLNARNAPEEIAQMIGYRDIVFTNKRQGHSPYVVADLRPLSDQCSIYGNIYVYYLNKDAN